MKDTEKILRLNIAFVQRIKSGTESRKPERPDRGKTTHAVFINMIARSLLANDFDIFGVKNSGRDFVEDKRCFDLMYKACPRNVQCLSMDDE